MLRMPVSPPVLPSALQRCCSHCRHLAQVSAERLGRLDDFLDAYVTEGRIPGAVLHVTHDGRTVYHRAVGARDIEANAPMVPDTIFRIASMSKAVVSTAVMILQERGGAARQPTRRGLPAGVRPNHRRRGE